MEKKIYIVKGQHDGNIGAYSNIKRAYEPALRYAQEGSEKHGVMCYIINKKVFYKKATYKRAVDRLKKHGRIDIYDTEDESTCATIELFYLNQ